jgi:hypothetical protein
VSESSSQCAAQGGYIVPLGPLLIGAHKEHLCSFDLSVLPQQKSKACSGRFLLIHGVEVGEISWLFEFNLQLRGV